MKKYTEKEWLEEGEKLFGKDRKLWNYKCASCGLKQNAKDFFDRGVSKEELQKGIVGFSCVGRWVDNMGCDWTLGGFLQVHKAEIITGDGETVPVFEFA